jgi:hypothetical protein
MWIDCSFNASEMVGVRGRGQGGGGVRLTFEPLMHVKVFQFLFCMAVFTIFYSSLFNNARAPRKGGGVLTLHKSLATFFSLNKSFKLFLNICIKYVL